MRLAITSLFCVVLAACGGGGGGGGGSNNTSTATATPNVQPTASAGPDFSIDERSTASLDGSASQDSDGSITSYAWRQTSGPAVTIGSANQVTATFDAPEVAPTGADLVFELTVRDNGGATATAAVTVSIVNVNLAPTAAVGADRSEPERTSISLDASASVDPDEGIASYQWQQTAGPAVSIDQPDSATTSVTTPEVAVAGGTLEFAVTVTDTEGATDTDSVVISVFNVNLAPTADAGPDQSVYEGRSVSLDASNSSDQDGGIVEFSWELVSGFIVDIPDLDQPQISFIAPPVQAPFENVYRLTVTDDLGETATDQVSVIISPIIPPVSNAGPDQIVEGGTSVALTALGSSDSDGAIISYQWNQIDGPAVALSDTTSTQPTFVAPTVADVTLIQFELVVTDDSATSANDSVNITITPPQHDVSGTITISEGTLVDSDVNDPAAPYESNDFPDVAQFLPGAVTVGGYANRAFRGADGRSYASGDVADFYRLQLEAGQSAVLYIGDSTIGDLDLYLWDFTGTQILDASTSITDTEVVIAPGEGEFLLEVFTWSGASAYVMEVETTASSGSVDSAASLHQDFIPHQAIVKQSASVAGSSTAAFKTATVAALGIKPPARRGSAATLISMAPSIDGMAAMSGRQSDELAKRSAAFRDSMTRQKWETLLAIKMLDTEPGVEYAEPNFIRKINFVPDDELYERQWHYPFINVPEAWDVTLGDSSVVVAVVDEGVLVNHPDLMGNMSDGYDFISSTSISNDGDGIDADPDDPGAGCGEEPSSFHGTHVQGTIGAATNNQTGVAGIAPGATMMPVRALGCGGGTSYDVAQAVLYASGLSNDSGIIVDNPADIINLSLGGGGFSQFGQDTFSAARDAGVIVVAAAGNSATSAPFFPAGYDGVISVSAVGSDGIRAGYSNFGPNVDLAAPGGATSADVNNDGFPDLIYSTDGEEVTDNPIDFTYEYKAGTSMAAPHVAGVIALMKSVNDSLSPADIDAMLVRGEIVVDIGRTGWDQLYGWGLIDARLAVDEAIASIGSPPADRPAMVVSPNDLQLGAFTNGTTLEISNAAGGDLVVSDISIPTDAAWLSIVQDVVDSNGVGTYAVTATRDGLAEGVYSADVTITSNSNDAVFPVRMIVPPELAFTANAGVLYVLLTNVDAESIAFGGRVELVSGELQFFVPGVYQGTYEIRAGSDSDDDFFICDGGESCGAFTDLSAPTQVLIDGDRTDLDFVVDYDWFLPAPTATSGDSPPSEGFAIEQSDQ